MSSHLGIDCLTEETFWIVGPVHAYLASKLQSTNLRKHGEILVLPLSMARWPLTGMQAIAMQNVSITKGKYWWSRVVTCATNYWWDWWVHTSGSLPSQARSSCRTQVFRLIPWWINHISYTFEECIQFHVIYIHIVYIYVHHCNHNGMPIPLFCWVLLASRTS